MKQPFPNISKLKIPIYSTKSGLFYTLSNDIRKALKQNKLSIKKFHELFGCQTCMMVDGKIGLYLCDVEAVLERMINRRLIGTQHPALWD